MARPAEGPLQRSALIWEWPEPFVPSMLVVLFSLHLGLSVLVKLSVTTHFRSP